MAAANDNPVLNGPFDPPERHFEINLSRPTGAVREGRRPSESWVPVPATRKGRRGAASGQDAFDFDLTGERREVNDK